MSNPCVGCGKLMTGRKRKYCTVRCGHIARDRKRSRARLSPQRVCPKCSSNFTAKAPNQMHCSSGCTRKCYRKTCPGCGKESWHSQDQTKSQALCKQCRALRAAGIREIRAKERDAARVQRPAISCIWCNRLFIPTTANQSSCSTVRRKRIVCSRKHLQRRGLRQQPTISIAEIYSRDGGKCGLCKRKVSLLPKTPYRLSATIDHIVPISQGGSHTRQNVQLAHFGCNSAKRDRNCGSQLILIDWKKSEVPAVPRDLRINEGAFLR